MSSRLNSRFEAFPDDFHVQQAQKAAVEPETATPPNSLLEEERRIVQPAARRALRELRVLVGIHDVETGKDHRLDLFESRQRLELDYFPR